LFIFIITIIVRVETQLEQLKMQATKRVDVYNQAPLGLVLERVVLYGAVHARVAEINVGVLPLIAACVAVDDVLVSINGEAMVNTPLSILRELLAIRPVTLRFAASADIGALPLTQNGSVVRDCAGISLERPRYTSCSECGSAFALRESLVGVGSARHWFCARCFVGKRVRVNRREQWGVVAAYEPPPVNRHVVRLDDDRLAHVLATNADLALEELRVAAKEPHALALETAGAPRATMDAWAPGSLCTISAVHAHRTRSVESSVLGAEFVDFVGAELPRRVNRDVLEYLVTFRLLSERKAAWVHAAELEEDGGGVCAALYTYRETHAAARTLARESAAAAAATATASAPTAATAAASAPAMTAPAAEEDSAEQLSPMYEWEFATELGLGAVASNMPMPHTPSSPRATLVRPRSETRADTDADADVGTNIPPLKRARLQPTIDTLLTHGLEVERIIDIRDELSLVGVQGLMAQPHMCVVCHLDEAARQLVSCDGCDAPHHSWCLPLAQRTRARERRTWLCPTCTRKLAAQNEMRSLACAVAAAARVEPGRGASAAEGGAATASAEESKAEPLEEARVLGNITSVAQRDPASILINALANVVPPRINAMLYCVKWRGRPYTEMTWESVEDVGVEALMRFHQINRLCVPRGDAAAAIVAAMSASTEARTNLVEAAAAAHSRSQRTSSSSTSVAAASTEEALIEAALALANKTCIARVERCAAQHPPSELEEKQSDWIASRITHKLSCIVQLEQGSENGASMIANVLERLRAATKRGAITGGGCAQPDLILVSEARRALYERELRRNAALVVLSLDTAEMASNAGGSFVLAHKLKCYALATGAAAVSGAIVPSADTAFSFDVAVMSLECFLENSALGRVPWRSIVVDQAHEQPSLKEPGKIGKLYSAARVARIMVTDAPRLAGSDAQWKMLNFMRDASHRAGTLTEFRQQFAYDRGAGSALGGELYKGLDDYLRYWVITLGPGGKKGGSAAASPDVGAKLRAVRCSWGKRPVVLETELSMLQRRLYRRVLLAHRELLRGDRDVLLNPLPSAELKAMLVQLQQLCTHPFLLSDVEDELRAEVLRSDSAVGGGRLDCADAAQVENFRMEQLMNVSAKFQLVDKLVLHARTQMRSIAIVANCESTVELLEQVLEWRGIRVTCVTQRVIGGELDEVGGAGRGNAGGRSSTDSRVTLLHSSQLSTLAPGFADAIVLLDFDWTDLPATHAANERLAERFYDSELFVLAARSCAEMHLLLRAKACASGGDVDYSAEVAAPTAAETIKIIVRSSSVLFSTSIVAQSELSRQDFRADVDAIFRRAGRATSSGHSQVAAQLASCDAVITPNLMVSELVVVEKLLWHLEADALVSSVFNARGGTNTAGKLFRDSAFLRTVRCVAETEHLERFAASSAHTLDEALQRLGAALVCVLDHPLFFEASTSAALQQTMECVERAVATRGCGDRSQPLLLGRHVAVRRALQQSVELVVVEELKQPGCTVSRLVEHTLTEQDQTDELSEERKDGAVGVDDGSDATGTDDASDSAIHPMLTTLQRRQLMAQAVLIGKCLLNNTVLLPGLVRAAAPHDAFVRIRDTLGRGLRVAAQKRGVVGFGEGTDSAILARRGAAQRKVDRGLIRTRCACNGTGCIAGSCGCARAGGFCGPLCACIACANMASEVCTRS
jgi:hypothetical protein